jgi:hypothetical protein
MTSSDSQPEEESPVLRVVRGMASDIVQACNAFNIQEVRVPKEKRISVGA